MIFIVFKVFDENWLIELVAEINLKLKLLSLFWKFDVSNCKVLNKELVQLLDIMWTICFWSFYVTKK